MVMRSIRAILSMVVIVAGFPALAGERLDFRHGQRAGQIFNQNSVRHFSYGGVDRRGFRVAADISARGGRHNGTHLQYIPQLGQLSGSGAIHSRTIHTPTAQSEAAGAADSYFYGASNGITVIKSDGPAGRDEGRPLAKVIQVEYGQNACSYEESVCVIRP